MILMNAIYMPEQQLSADTEQQHRKPEIDDIETIDHLIGYLGYTENPEQQQLKIELIRAYKDKDEKSRELMTNYQILAEEAIEVLPQEEADRAHLGYLLALAAIRRDGGKQLLYLEGLEDAVVYAANMRAYRSVYIIVKTLLAEIESKE